MLANLDRPLLSTSVHVEAEGELEIPEGAIMMDMFAGRGLDFVVDCGTRVCCPDTPQPSCFVSCMEVFWKLQECLNVLQ